MHDRVISPCNRDRYLRLEAISDDAHFSFGFVTVARDILNGRETKVMTGGDNEVARRTKGPRFTEDDRGFRDVEAACMRYPLVGLCSYIFRVVTWTSRGHVQRTELRGSSYARNEDVAEFR